MAGVAAEGTAVAGATAGVAEDGEKLLFLKTISNCHLLFVINIYLIIIHIISRITSCHLGGAYIIAVITYLCV